MRLPRQSSKIVDSLAPVLQRCELTWTANEPKSVVTGSVKRAEVAAYADCTQSQMMAMFGWTDPKMPARYISQSREARIQRHGQSCCVRPERGFRGERDRNDHPERSGNIPGKHPEKRSRISELNVGLWCARRDSNPHDVTHCHLKAARLPIPLPANATSISSGHHAFGLCRPRILGSSRGADAFVLTTTSRC